MQEGLQSKPRQLELPGLESPPERLVTAKISREPEQSDIRLKAAAYLLQANPPIYPPNNWLSHHVSNELKTLRSLLAPGNELIEFAKHCISKRLELLYPTGKAVQDHRGSYLRTSPITQKVYDNLWVECAFNAIISPDTYNSLWKKSGVEDGIGGQYTQAQWHNSSQRDRQEAFQRILAAAFKILENDPKLNPSKPNDPS